MEFIDVNGLTFAYEIHGSGPPLLNISGSGGDLRTSYPQHSPLNKAFTVLHYDQRSLGQTSRPSGQQEMAAYADDAAALCRAIGWGASHVVGTSFGGMVAQHLAIRHPDQVGRLVLNCTSPGGLRPSFPLHTIEELDTEARIEMMMGLLDNRWDPGEPDPIPGLGGAYDYIVKGYRTERDPDAYAGYLSHLDARSRHDATRDLGAIESPTLVCAGEFDDLAPPINSITLTDAIPGAGLRVFNGGHLFFLQDDTAWPTIIDFLNGELDTESATETGQA